MRMAHQQTNENRTQIFRIYADLFFFICVIYVNLRPIYRGETLAKTN